MLIAKYIIISFVFLMGIACVYGLIFPNRLTQRVFRIWHHPSGLPIAVAARLVFGLALILFAQSSRFPVTLTLLGGLAVLAALLIAVLGKEKIGQLIEWAAKSSVALMRSWLLFGLLLAGFLLYAVT